MSWSLKGKSITCKDAALTIYPGFSVYPDIIIETLREKLIEDIKKYRDFSGPNYANVIDIIEIINKRFGVEE